MIILASSNKGKVKEFKLAFKNEEVLSLADIGYTAEIEENGTTFFENALIKATEVEKFLQKKSIVASVIADDSGLCVDTLGGAPGVFSARYNGIEDHNSALNREKLLKELDGKDNRNAHFCCALVELFPNGDYISVEGKTYGKITTEELGDTSFGYDCLFLSDDLNKTFGQATGEEKLSVSHRGRAIENLKIKRAEYLSSNK